VKTIEDVGTRESVGYGGLLKTNIPSISSVDLYRPSAIDFFEQVPINCEESTFLHPNTQNSARRMLSETFDNMYTNNPILFYSMGLAPQAAAPFVALFALPSLIDTAKNYWQKRHMRSIEKKIRERTGYQIRRFGKEVEITKDDKLVLKILRTHDIDTVVIEKREKRDDVLRQIKDIEDAYRSLQVKNESLEKTISGIKRAVDTWNFYDIEGLKHTEQEYRKSVEQYIMWLAESATPAYEARQAIADLAVDIDAENGKDYLYDIRDKLVHDLEKKGLHFQARKVQEIVKFEANKKIRNAAIMVAAGLLTALSMSLYTAYADGSMYRVKKAVCEPELDGKDLEYPTGAEDVFDKYGRELKIVVDDDYKNVYIFYKTFKVDKNHSVNFWFDPRGDGGKFPHLDDSELALPRNLWPTSEGCVAQGDNLYDFKPIVDSLIQRCPQKFDYKVIYDGERAIIEIRIPLKALYDKFGILQRFGIIDPENSSNVIGFHAADGPIGTATSESGLRESPLGDTGLGKLSRHVPDSYKKLDFSQSFLGNFRVRNIIGKLTVLANSLFVPFSGQIKKIDEVKENGS